MNLINLSIALTRYLRVYTTSRASEHSPGLIDTSRSNTRVVKPAASAAAVVSVIILYALCRCSLYGADL